MSAQKKTLEEPEIPQEWRRKSSVDLTLDFLDSTQSDYEQALVATGFGKFHFFLLAVCGLIYMNTAIGITILSFVLPSATCDFEMTSEDKGWLTASPMFGMILGSAFWGCLADIKGRKYVLVATLLLDGICGVLSSVSPNYYFFVFFRFFNGFGITGAMLICFPYLGEFQPTRYREKILCWMEIFWTLGVIVLPLIAWATIPLAIGIQYQNFRFHSWNLFVMICALPSLIIAIMLFFFPESPKYLIEVGENEWALDVLESIFQMNTGKPKQEYPIKSLKRKTIEGNMVSLRGLSFKTFSHLRLLINEVLLQTQQLFQPPHRKNTILTCAIQFGLTASYYTLMNWFPEIFYRFEEYRKHFPDRETSLCVVSSVNIANGTDIFCGDAIDENVYWHTLIIGIACIPTSLILPACIHQLGAKFFIIFSMFIAGGVTVGLEFVVNPEQNLILSCVFEALTSLGISTIYCVMVDLFPTNLRVMAAALSLTFGRGGALLGNILFGFLIDFNCHVPVIVFSSMLFISGILCFFLPTTGREALD